MADQQRPSQGPPNGHRPPLRNTLIVPIHPAVILPQGIVICEVCDGFLSDYSNLQTHLLRVHSINIHRLEILEYPPIKCLRCECRFFTEIGVERHLLAAHGLISMNLQNSFIIGLDRCRCPLCGNSQTNFLNHVAIDHAISIKPTYLIYRCTICFKVFMTYRLFRLHFTRTNCVLLRKMQLTRARLSVAARDTATPATVTITRFTKTAIFVNASTSTDDLATASTSAAYNATPSTSAAYNVTPSTSAAYIATPSISGVRPTIDSASSAFIATPSTSAAWPAIASTSGVRPTIDSASSAFIATPSTSAAWPAIASTSGVRPTIESASSAFIATPSTSAAWPAIASTSGVRPAIKSASSAFIATPSTSAARPEIASTSAALTANASHNDSEFAVASTSTYNTSPRNRKQSFYKRPATRNEVPMIPPLRKRRPPKSSESDWSSDDDE